jgi:hypothetical protein
MNVNICCANITLGRLARQGAICKDDLNAHGEARERFPKKRFHYLDKEER